LYGENNVFLTSAPLGDTCGQTEIKVTIEPDAKFCEGAVDETAVAATDYAVDETAVAATDYAVDETTVADTDSAPSDVFTEDRCFITDPSDFGYNDEVQGWYDVSGCGVCNDYCRNVGSEPNIRLSCKLAGSTDEYTPADYDWGTPDNLFSWPKCSGKGASSTQSAADNAADAGTDVTTAVQAVPTYSPSYVPSAQVSARNVMMDLDFCSF
jgi:hypothetical protein